MTRDGIKTEDYREITPYWAKRLLLYQDSEFKDTLNYSEVETLCNDLNGIVTYCFNELTISEELLWVLDDWYLSFKPFDTTTLTLGYPSSTDTSRIIKFEHAGIEIRTGNPEWGAEEGKLYFVIKHGKRIQ